MKRLAPISVFILIVLLLSSASPAAAAQAGPTSIYVVRSGDTAYSIATRHCMTVQQLQNLNGAVISNPNQIFPGMQLRVVNQCGGSGGGGGCSGANCSGVFDRGPTQHARGQVSGNVYQVVRGDTSFSIAQRFGISVLTLCRANGINPWFIWAGQRLIIPGLTSNPCPQPCPPIVPTVLPATVIPITPSPTVPPIQAWIAVNSPASNASLPPTFTVTGTGQGLVGGALLVRATADVSWVLAEASTTLQGSNVGAGGQGTFSVQLTVNVAQATAGFITVSAPQTPAAAPVRIPVTFTPGSTGGVVFHEFSGQECRVSVAVAQPFFSDVGGSQAGAFAATNTFVATRGARLNNQLWFFIGPVPGATASVWVPMTSISTLTSGCWW